ncbi:hypothetical protein AVEN_213976-1 [Araneus ventricosus]|uniref:Uncharacterized protein n=1 Tax=Araneus ventricosus TaxID=182803 RepID=A0A4Y2N4T0_ARAVE|nr:hypothetical protein AVEN_213976-1 [Araneus ventricosus]
MEKQLNLVSKLSLNEMALRRVVINLWFESDISAAVGRPRNIEFAITYGAVWGKDIIEVKERVSRLVLPESLKKRMMDLVRPVRTEIRKWKLFHEHILNDISNEEFDMRILEQLCWTCTGAVDYRKTAVELVCLEMLDVEKRYRLACLYCLEDYIPVLWVELPEKYKSRFNEEIYPLPENVVHLEYYWASVLKGEEFKLNDILPREFVDVSSTYQSYFNYSACKGSKAATEYFFQKLTVEERDSALFITLCEALGRYRSLCLPGHKDEKPISDVLCYLLSLMAHEQRMQFFKNQPSGCLMCFLDWPLAELFLDIADIIWNFLPESQYEHVLDRLSDNISSSNMCHYLPDLFQKFFMRSPINFRKLFVDRECQGRMFTFFTEFIYFEDTETIKVVLRNLDSDDRMRLVTDLKFCKLLSFLMFRDKWHLVELCVLEAVRSKEDWEILKEAYMTSAFHCREGNWKRFFEWFDGIGASASSTKCSEDETLTKAKRLSSEEEKYDLTKKRKRH